MPVSTGSPTQTTFPSFMSVFGNGSTTGANESSSHSQDRNPSTDKKPYLPSYNPSLRRDSASTCESVESSPTTTVSTVASSLTQLSPNSSPESPNTALKPGSGYLRSNSNSSQGTMEKQGQFSNSFPTLPGLEKTDSPQKKMRNMRNLSVNTAASNRTAASQLPRLGLASATLPPPKHASSAPPTPAFIVPPKPPRRQPSNLGLSITTPDSNNNHPQDSLQNHAQLPPDPQIKTLRRLQTATDGFLQSPTVAPEGGMRLPPFNPAAAAPSLSHVGKSIPPLSISPNSHSSPIKKQTLEHVQEEPDYELPLSQEAKSPAYPQGPVCIYDPYVYLYLEPTRVEASEFDVILNVAREVVNPFLSKDVLPPAPASENRMVDKGVQVGRKNVDKGVQASFDDFQKDSGVQTVPSEPQTAASEASFSSALESLMDDNANSAPSTPKATKPEPEYIHVPWDHNANVVDDLLRLCQLIDDRVRQRKRVLVHCQCGVSRSASLVVAYGIYQNPRLTVTEAYDAVKSRSRWIGPNMNLIYQLSEFKTKLAKSQQAWPSWDGFAAERPGKGLTIDAEAYTSRDRLDREDQSSTGSASQQNNRLSSSAPNVSYNVPNSAQLVPPSRFGDVTPGPLSAPPKYQFKFKEVADNHTSSPITQKPLQLAIDTDKAREIDRDQIFSPTVHETQTEAPPIGAVASDLREIARELDHSPGLSMLPPRQGTANEDMESAKLEPPGSWPPGESDSPRLVSKNSLSNLKIGFSRLFNRRQQDDVPPLPFRQKPPPISSTDTKSSPLNSALLDDVPPTPSLLSPRAAEFTASPFHRTSAGDLAGSSTFEQGLMSPQALDDDPRSPHQRGEAPITRSIFDVI